MRENSWAQAFAPVRQQAEEPSLQHDDQHDSAVVAVGQSEKHRLGDDGERATAGPRKELADQIAAEQQFFAEGATHGEHQKNHQLHWSLRSIGPSARRASRGTADQANQQSDQRYGDDQKAERDSQVAKESGDRGPAARDQTSQREP